MSSNGEYQDEATPLINISTGTSNSSGESSVRAGLPAPSSSSSTSELYTTPIPPPSSSYRNRVRVGLDTAVLDNQKKWKHLTDISDDNSTAKDMASEVQNEFLKFRKQRTQEEATLQGSGIPNYHFGGENGEDDKDPDAIDEELQDAFSSSRYVLLETDKYLIAAAFIKDGIHGRKIGYRLDRTAMFLNEIWHSGSYRLMYTLVVAVACLLAFVEAPGEWNAYLAADITCVLLFTTDVAICWYMSSDVTKAKFISRQPWTFVQILLLGVTVLDMTTNLLLPMWNPYRYSRALRPFFLITRRRNIRIIFASCLRALREVLIVLLLTFCLIGFFGLIGYLLFSDVTNDPSATYFNSLSTSLYTMLLIQNCLPYMVKAMYPYYKLTHWSSVFFVLFVLLTTLFLMKLTIAVSYRSYKQHTEKMLYKRLQKRKAALFAAFDILAQDVDLGKSSSPSTRMLSNKNRRGSSRFFLGGIDKFANTSFSQTTTLITPINRRQISLDTWVQVCQYLKPKWSATEAGLVFNTIDIEHVGYLDLGDFYQLCSLLSVQLERPAPKSILRNCCSSASRHKIRRLQLRLRNLLLYEILLFGKYPVVVAELIVGCLICLSVIQAVQVNNIELAFSVNRSWRLLGFTLLILFTIEVILKLFAFGSSEFFLRPFCKLDLAIVSVGWIFYVITSMDDPSSVSLVFYDLALAVRSLRILKLLNLFPPFHEILYTMKRILALILQLLLVIFCFMYAFAIFTQANYGLALRKFPEEKKALSPNWYAVREEFQVDTFDETLVTLFGVANLAGWDIVMDAAHAMTNSNTTYVFFFCYRIGMSNILLPIFVGFLVESFVSNANSVNNTIQTYVDAAVQNQDEADRMAILASKVDGAEGKLASGGGPHSPVSWSNSSEGGGELRLKFQRRGSLVHNPMFDSVKLSDVSRLKLLIEKKDEEIAEQDMTIRKLEGNVLGMQSRLTQSQRVILAYEAKMEELSAALREAQILQRHHHSTTPGSSSHRRSASWRLWNP